MRSEKRSSRLPWKLSLCADVASRLRYFDNRCNTHAHTQTLTQTPSSPPPPGLSTYLPLRDEDGIISAANASTPVLQAHGDQDNVVRGLIGTD